MVAVASASAVRYCRTVRVHEDNKKNEGYGNHMHALVHGANMARACGLELQTSKRGRLGQVCEKLACRNVTYSEFHNVPPKFLGPPADLEVVYQSGMGARCHETRRRGRTQRRPWCPCR